MSFDHPYESAIPFPSRRLPTSPALFIQDYPSPFEHTSGPDLPGHLSPRPERPDVPTTPQLNRTPSTETTPTFDPPFSSAGGRPTALLPAFSPPRPRRPTHPEQAHMLDTSASHSHDQPVTPYPSDSSSSGSAPTPITRSFPSPPSPPLLTPPVPPMGNSPPRSPRRKPVPPYLAEPRPVSLIGVRTPSSHPSSAHEAETQVVGYTSTAQSPHHQHRLSISGFEALLYEGKRVRMPVQQLREKEMEVEDPDGRIVWSPRIHLGLANEGVEAREERLNLDSERDGISLLGTRFLGERDLGQREGLVGETEQQEDTTPRQGRRRSVAFDPRTPPSAGQSHTQGQTQQNPLGRETGSVRRFLTPKSARSKRSRTTSFDPQYDEEGEDAEVCEREQGPVLRRGSKRLSDLPSAGEEEEDEAEDELDAKSAGNNRASRKFSRVLRTKRSKEKQKSPMEGRTLPEVEVIVHEPQHEPGTASEGEEGWEKMSGDWEKVRKEATFRPERLNFSMVDYEGWFPRLSHLLYPFFIFAHIPVSLFLDYNLIYTLCQLALYPALPSTSLRNIATRSLVTTPDIQASTGWWVAVGVYSACTVVWFFGVTLWKEIGREYYARWGSGGKTVEIEKVYRGAASYNLACVRSYSMFSFLWRVRFAPFQPTSALARAAAGSSKMDGVRETLAWYRQNWPTVLLLLPRAGLSVAVLLLYSTTAYGSSAASTVSRDSAYFATNGTLSGFATGVLFANSVWAAWRLLVLLVAWVGLWLIARPSLLRPWQTSEDEPSAKFFHPSREHLTISSTLTYTNEKSHGQHFASLASRRSSITHSNWRIRRQRRLRAAILACLGSTPLTQTSSAFSPFFQSPYIFGRSPPLKQARSASAVARPDDSTQGYGQDRRLATLSLQGQERSPSPHATFEAEGAPLPRSPEIVGLWRSASRLVFPAAPKLAKSPLISFSPATPTVDGVSPALATTSGVEPSRRVSLAVPGAASESGDVGEAQLHRRIRSLPALQGAETGEEEEETIRFHDVPLASVARRAPPAPLPTLVFPSRQRHSIPALPPLHILSTVSSSSFGTLPDRPPLLSHFSAFSTQPSATSSAQPSPGIDYAPYSPARSPQMERGPTASSFVPEVSSVPLESSHSSSPQTRYNAPVSSPPLQPWHPSLTPNPSPRSPVLPAHAHVSSPQNDDRLSSRLLDEVQRVREADAARLAEERRVAGLGRISQATSTVRSATTARGTLSSSPPPRPLSAALGAQTSLDQAEDDDEDEGTQRNSVVDPRRISAAPSTSADSFFSQPSSVSGLSDSSTTQRGGAVRTPRLNLLEGILDGRFASTSPALSVGGEREGRGLEPFRLSYGSGADGLSLSNWGSPTLTLGDGEEKGEEGSGRFVDPSLVGRTD
ncbi:hypothetical protein JCM11641_007887 [Rhodosporidiobolus odoratus]